MNFDKIRKYISNQEQIKKEIYGTNTFCIFTNKKIYKGSISDNNEINLNVEELNTFQNIEYLQKPKSSSLLGLGIFFIIASIISFLFIIPFSISEEVNIPLIITVISTLLLGIILIVISNKNSLNAKFATLQINFIDKSNFTIVADNITEEEIQSIITETFLAKYNFNTRID